MFARPEALQVLPSTLGPLPPAYLATGAIDACKKPDSGDRVESVECRVRLEVRNARICQSRVLVFVDEDE